METYTVCITHRSGSYVYVVAGWTIWRPFCLVLPLGGDSGVGWSGGHKVVVEVENQEQEENGAVPIWVRCAAIVLSSKAFCDYCTHTWLLYWPMILVQQY